MSDSKLCDLAKLRTDIAAAIASRPGDFPKLATASVVAEAAEAEKQCVEALASIQVQIVDAEKSGDGPKLAQLSREVITARRAFAEAKAVAAELGRSHQKLAAEQAARAKVNLEERCGAAQRLIMRASRDAAARFNRIVAEGEAILVQLSQLEKAAIEGQITVLQAFVSGPPAVAPVTAPASGEAA